MAKQPQQKVLTPEVKAVEKPTVFTKKIEEKNELVTFTKKEKILPSERKGDA
jgi:hypothetical protein